MTLSFDKISLLLDLKGEKIDGNTLVLLRLLEVANLGVEDLGL